MDRPQLAIVSISGGKDSTATALIAKKRMGKRCRYVMADTGNEDELTIAYALQYLPTVLDAPVEVVKADFTRQITNKRAYIESNWRAEGVSEEVVQRALGVLHPTGNPFLDLCLWKGRFPSRKAQFCTQFLKRIPLDNYLLDRMAEGYEVSSWRGIRRDESQNRRDAQTREQVAEGYWIEQPIAGWTAQQVVDYVIGEGVRLNPLYSMGMGRVGCMPCINCSKDELLEISKRFPPHIDKVDVWEGLMCLASKRGWSTFFCDASKTSPVEVPGWRREVSEDDEGGPSIVQWVEPDSEVFARLNIHERVRWAETARGGRQIDFIRQEPPAGACSSMYGLCE